MGLQSHRGLLFPAPAGGHIDINNCAGDTAAGATDADYVARRAAPDRGQWRVHAKKHRGGRHVALPLRAQGEASRPLIETPPCRGMKIMLGGLLSGSDRTVG